VIPHWVFLVCIGLAVNLVGFRKFIWFVSLGYAFSVTSLVVGLGFLFRAELTIPMLLMLAVLAAYSLRLGLFLSIREATGGHYQKVLDEATSAVRKVPFFVSVAVWIAVTLLFFAQVSPLYFRLANGMAHKDEPLFIAGLAVSLFGFIMQAAADAWKSAAKKKDPRRFVSSGLYRLVRCPNYFGEILVWTGVFLGSMTCLANIWQWLVSSLGYAGIVFIMFNGARRLEKRQLESYSVDPEYQAYAARVPILIPCVPIYTLQSWKFLG